MAKKVARGYVTLECPECKNRNYHTQKRIKGAVAKLGLKKYCRRCRQHTKHVERRK